MTRVTLLDCAFDAVTEREAVQWAKEWIEASRNGTGRPGTIATVNVHILMALREDPRLRDFVDNAALVVADGQPIVWATSLRKPRLPERVTGVDLVDSLSAMAARSGFGVYLLGGREGVADVAAGKLRERHPGLDIRGCQHGYFGSDEVEAVVARVRESGAALLFVALGVPFQEYFIAAHAEALGAALTMGVGGSLDVISGNSKRAPRWMQRVGLEWFFRLCQEPRRLAGRYFRTNCRFLWALLFGPRRGRAADPAEDPAPSKPPGGEEAPPGKENV